VSIGFRVKSGRGRGIFAIRPKKFPPPRMGAGIFLRAPRGFFAGRIGGGGGGWDPGGGVWGLRVQFWQKNHFALHSLTFYFLLDFWGALSRVSFAGRMPQFLRGSTFFSEIVRGGKGAPIFPNNRKGVIIFSPLYPQNCGGKVFPTVFTRLGGDGFLIWAPGPMFSKSPECFGRGGLSSLARRGLPRGGPRAGKEKHDGINREAGNNPR